MSSILSPKQPNTVLYLPFNEGSGTTAYDYSDNANNGSITGASYVKVQDGDYALDFNGSSDYILANGVSTSLGAIPTEFTVSMRVKRNSRSGYKTLWSLGDSTPSGGSVNAGQFIGLGHYNTDNLWYWGYYDEFDTGFTMLNNVWYDIVFTLENTTTAKIYVNGNQVWTGTIKNKLPASDTFVIGKEISTSSYYYDGLFRLPTVFSKKLSAEVIKKLYQETYIE